MAAEGQCCQLRPLLPLGCRLSTAVTSGTPVLSCISLGPPSLRRSKCFAPAPTGWAAGLSPAMGAGCHPGKGLPAHLWLHPCGARRGEAGQAPPCFLGWLLPQRQAPCCMRAAALLFPWEPRSPLAVALSSGGGGRTGPWGLLRLLPGLQAAAAWARPCATWLGETNSTHTPLCAALTTLPGDEAKRCLRSGTSPSPCLATGKACSPLPLPLGPEHWP